MRRTSLFLVELLLFAALAHCHAQSVTEDTPEANPARPTVSTPATLTPPGYLQFETGTLGAQISPEFTTRFGVNQVTKLAVTNRVEFFAQTEPFVHSQDLSDREIHAGEVFGGVQAVLLPGAEHRPAISVSYIRRLYESPAPELDIGTFRQSVLILVSWDLWGFHADANGIFAEQSDIPLSRARRGQYGQTLSVSHPLKKFTISGEIWHFTQPALRGNSVGNLWAVSYPVRKNLVLDAGFDHGLTGTSTQWEGFAGFTYLLPHRLWKK